MKNKQLLIVDDLNDWRVTLMGLMMDAGFDVVSADSVQTALEATRGNHFDLALLDIRLDETDDENVDGLSLAFEIKKIDPNVKIIILTGYATEGILEKAFKADTTGKLLADDFISKVQTDELLEIVKRLLAKHS